VSGVRELGLAEARRLVLAAQGFDRPRPARVTARHLREVIERLGLLQLDFVTVLVPAHYHVPFSRLGPYPRRLLDDLAYRQRHFTEAWAHEASLVPVDAWPLLRYRRERHRVRPRAYERAFRKLGDYAQAVLGHVRDRGPVGAGDLPTPEGRARRVRHSWYGTWPRIVLEAHFGAGRLAVAGRRANFSRAFDLPERIVPDAHRGRTVDEAEAQRELLRRAARALAVATAADLADYWRMPVREARPRLRELVDAGDLLPARVEGWREPALLHPQARAPRGVSAAALLSPFDPLIWFRRRTRRLFDFDYRMEVFVPAAQRRWGVYVLPFLLGERLVARVDVKTDRTANVLRVLAAFGERHAPAGAVVPALAAELAALAGWLGLSGVHVERRGDLARALAAGLRRRGD
jgi:uncharacterized protein YcaQ